MYTYITMVMNNTMIILLKTFSYNFIYFLFIETASRGLVSRAVYEEWYFRKQQEAKAIRDAKIQEEKEKKWKEENVCNLSN